MIVHTGGGYHYNTLMGVLFFDYNKRNLYTLHRLDRLTSGLIIFAKDLLLVKIYVHYIFQCFLIKYNLIH